MSAAANVRKAYRDLYHIVRQMPAKDRPKHMVELRTSFRQPIGSNETVEDRVRKAHDRASFLRITSVKTKPRGEAGRWVYKDGQRLESDATGTLRDAKGRVVSNWDGKNLDPCSVKIHKQQFTTAKISQITLRKHRTEHQSHHGAGSATTPFAGCAFPCFNL